LNTSRKGIPPSEADHLARNSGEEKKKRFGRREALDFNTGTTSASWRFKRGHMMITWVNVKRDEMNLGGFRRLSEADELG